MRGARLGLALFAAACLAPVAAHAQNVGGESLLSRLNYGVQGGLMVPEGPQGVSLASGPFASINVHGESALGMQLGFEASYIASDDALRTRFAGLSALARLSPVPEDYRAFVQLSGGFYHVTYDPKVSTVAKPGSTTRPGGSFGIGFDAIEASNFSIGGVITYHGVVLGRSQARSFLIAALNVTFKPSRY